MRKTLKDDLLIQRFVAADVHAFLHKLPSLQAPSSYAIVDDSSSGHATSVIFVKGRPGQKQEHVIYEHR